MISTKVISLNDVSELPVIKSKFSDNPVYIISYADNSEVYEQNQHALTFSAINNGFNRFIEYNMSDIDKDFLQKNNKIFTDNPHGYWLWKPYFILKTLENSPPDSIIFYADCGFVIKKPVDDLIAKVNKSGMIFVDRLPESLANRVDEVTSTFAMNSLQCISSECKSAKHLLGGFSIYKNNENTRNFVRKWLENMQDFDILNGKVMSREHKNFRFHKNDESVLSITNFKNNHDQGYISYAEMEKYAYLHHRRGYNAKGNSFRDKLNRDDSLLALKLRSNRQLRSFERQIYNSKLLSSIRDILRSKS